MSRGLFDDRRALLGIAAVAFDEQNVGAGTAEIARHRLGLSLARMIMDRHFCALRAETARERRANAGRGAGDEYDLAGKIGDNEARVWRGSGQGSVSWSIRRGLECEPFGGDGQLTAGKPQPLVRETGRSIRHAPFGYASSPLC